MPVWGQAQQTHASSIQAQTGGQLPTPTASIRTQANLVLLDVVVTQNGAAIHGLAKDKFHVLDNGVAQQVTVF